jgi:hypothetical protein
MNPQPHCLAKFRIGRIVTMPNAFARLTSNDILAGIRRHHAGDWGDVDEHDRQANERGLIGRTRLWSVYHSANGVRFWIITEADRSSTTILMPEDY